MDPVTCPVCGAELRYPVGAACPICGEPLSQATRDAARIAAETHARETATSIPILPRPVSSPSGPVPQSSGPRLTQGPALSVPLGVQNAVPIPPSGRPPVKPTLPLNTAPGAAAPWPGSPQAAVQAKPAASAAANARPTAAPAPGASSVSQWHAGALGRHVESYTGSYSGLATFAVMSLLGTVGAGYYAASTAQNGWWVAAVVCLVLFISSWASAANRAVASVEMFERGVNVKRGTDAEAFSYDDVQNVWYQGLSSSGGTPVVTRYTVELPFAKRVPIVTTNYAKSGALATTLNTQLTNTLTARALRDLQSGKRLTYGGVTVDSAGLSNGRETLPWSEIRDVLVNSSAVTIYRRGKSFAWAQLSTERTPNAFVLLMIANAKKGGAVP